MGYLKKYINFIGEFDGKKSILKGKGIVKDIDTEYGEGWDNDADIMYEYMLQNHINDKDVLELRDFFERYES